MEKLIKNRLGQWSIVEAEPMAKGWDKGIRLPNYHPIFDIHHKLTTMIHNNAKDKDISSYLDSVKEHITPNSVHHLITTPEERDRYNVDRQDIENSAAQGKSKLNAQQIFGPTFAQENALGHLAGMVHNNMSPRDYADIAIGQNADNANLNSSFHEYFTPTPNADQHLAVLKRLKQWHQDGQFMKKWGPDQEGIFNEPKEHIDWALGHAKTQHLENEPRIKAAKADLYRLPSTPSAPSSVVPKGTLLN